MSLLKFLANISKPTQSELNCLQTYLHRFSCWPVVAPSTESTSQILGPSEMPPLLHPSQLDPSALISQIDFDCPFFYPHLYCLSPHSQDFSPHYLNGLMSGRSLLSPASLSLSEYTHFNYLS